MKGNSLHILYAAVMVLASELSQDMANQEYIDIIMPPIMKRFSNTQPDSKDYCPLVECLVHF